MANDLKGITVKIGGDTKDLKKALEGVDKDAKSTSKELKEVNKQLKYDPKNTVLLTQKHELLGKQIEDTKTKLENLKTAQSQFSDEAKNTEEGAAQYRSLQREIEKTEGQLKNLEKQYDATSDASLKIQKITDSLDGVSKKATDVGTNLTTHVSAPIAAVVTAAVAAFDEVDKGSDTIVMKTGATGEALDSMDKSMRNLAEQIPTDFETAGAAVGEVNTRFGLTGDALEDLSGKFIKFAQLNNTDVSSSIDSVQKALSAYGLGAEDAGTMLDVLNRTSQNTGVSVDTLTNGLVQNGTAFQELGLSASQSIALMGQLEKSGANSETVMNGMRKALKNASADGISLSDALGNLQNEIKNSDDQTKALNDTYDLFGKSGDQIYAAIRNGSLDFNSLASETDILNDSMNSVDSTFEGTLDPTDRLKTVMNQLKDTGADIAESLMPAISTAMTSLSKVITNLKGKWDSLSKGQQSAIVKIAGIAAVAGPAIVAFGKLAGGISSVIKTGKTLVKGIDAIKTAFSTGGAAAKLFGSAFTFLTSPIGIAVAAIAGAVAAIVLLYNKCEWFRDTVNTVLEFLKQAFSVAFQAIGNVVQVAFQLISGVWQNILQPVFQAIGSFLTGTLGPVFSTVFNAISSVVSTVFNAIKGFWTGILQPAFQAIGSFLNGTLGPVFSTIFNSIKTVVSDVFNAIKGFWDSILKPVFEAIKSACQPIFDTVSRVFGNIKTTISDTFDKIKSHLEPIVDWLKGIFKNMHWDLPKIRLPHFHLTGKFSLKDMTVPHLSVDWYSKAMKQAIMLDGATIYGQRNDGTLLGGGESGREMIVGTDYLVSAIQQAMASQQSIGNITVNVYGADRQNAKQLADQVENDLTARLKRRGFSLS